MMTSHENKEYIQAARNREEAPVASRVLEVEQATFAPLAPQMEWR